MYWRSEARVKLRFLLLTALIRVPSMASNSRPNRSSCRPAQQHELAEDRAEGRMIVAAEVGNRFEVFQMPQQPDHLDVAMGLGFKPSAGAHPVQVTVDVQLQQVGRRITRPARR